MLQALAEPWLQTVIICWWLEVFAASHHTPGRHCGEQETQRTALRQRGNCGTLIHLLLLFQACVCSALLAAFYTPPAAEAVSALGEDSPQLPFPLPRQFEGC